MATRGRETIFDAAVADGWKAGRGPHGGYMAAMLLRALMEAVAEPRRAPRSLTIHYARAPVAGPVRIRTVLEREGRSLSTLSARIEQEGHLVALALAAFSVPWSGPEISELPLPDVAGPERRARGGLRAGLRRPRLHAPHDHAAPGRGPTVLRDGTGDGVRRLDRPGRGASARRPGAGLLLRRPDPGALHGDRDANGGTDDRPDDPFPGRPPADRSIRTPRSSASHASGRA